MAGVFTAGPSVRSRAAGGTRKVQFAAPVVSHRKGRTAER